MLLGRTAFPLGGAGFEGRDQPRPVSRGSMTSSRYPRFAAVNGEWASQRRTALAVAEAAISADGQARLKSARMCLEHITS